jgi:hypothetical protein
MKIQIDSKFEKPKPKREGPLTSMPAPMEAMPVVTFEVDGAAVTCQRVNAQTVRLQLQGTDPKNQWLHDAHCPADSAEEWERLQYEAARLVFYGRKHKAIK